MAIKFPWFDQFGAAFTPLPSTTITAAGTVTGTVFDGLPACTVAGFQAVFTYGAGGTTVDAYVQTTLDHGATWIDVANFHFIQTTATKVSKVSVYAATAAGVVPTDGTLASNTILDGVLGNQWRVKVVSAGTYSGGTTLSVSAVLKA